MTFMLIGLTEQQEVANVLDLLVCQSGKYMQQKFREPSTSVEFLGSNGMRHVEQSLLG